MKKIRYITPLLCLFTYHFIFKESKMVFFPLFIVSVMDPGKQNSPISPVSCHHLRTMVFWRLR